MKQHLRDDIVCVLREELLALSMMKEIFKPTILCEIEDHLSVVPPHMTHTQFSPLEDPCQAIIQTHCTPLRMWSLPLQCLLLVVPSFQESL